MPAHLDPFASWSNLEGARSAVAAARDAVDALLRDRGLRRTTPELTTESLLAGAVASAALEGSSATRDDLRDGRGDAMALAVARLNSELLSLVPVIGRSPLQSFARMHTLAAVGAVPDDQLGRPRPGAGVADGLVRLSKDLLASGNVPAIAVAAITHAEIVRLAPFASHNGVVGRAVERLILVARGVDPTSMLVPEAGHLVLEDEYSFALEAYAEGTSAGLHRWLLHAARAITNAVEASPLREV